MRTLSLTIALSFFLVPLLAQEATKEAAKEPAKEAAAQKTAPDKPKVRRLRPNGNYADLAEASFGLGDLIAGGGAPPKSFYKLIEGIDDAAGGDAGPFLLDLSGAVGFNMPQVRELERALGRLRAKGNKLIAYIEHGSPVAYQLASLCDRIVMAEMGMLDLRSPALTTMHFKDALDLLGVQVEVTRVGAFKGAVEPYMLPEMSEHLREHYREMLRTMNDDLVARIAKGRKLDPAKVRELQGQRMFGGKAAVAAGLVDRLVPWDGAERALRAEVDGEFELVDALPKPKKKNRDLFAMFSEMFRGSREREEALEEPTVAVLHLSGAIQDGDKAMPGSMVAGPAVADIDKLAADEQVKGVVVRINSPGGSATASEAIRLALARLAAKKPVVFSMGELAASGGYWITTIGQPILAEPTTITGSIGVFGMQFKMGALMRRLGVKEEIVAVDAGPLMDAIDRPMSEHARDRIQAFVDEIYTQFLANVSKSRKLSVDAVDAIAGGRVWSGAQAVDLKLVDKLGGIEDALAMVRERAKVDADVEVAHYPKPRDFAASLLEGMFGDGDDTGMRSKLAQLAARAFALDDLLPLLEQAAGDGAMRVYAQMPGSLRVR